MKAMSDDYSPLQKNEIAWVRIPADLKFLAGKGLTPADKVVWHEVNRCIQAGPRAVAARVGRVAEACETDETTVRTALAKLVQAGLLTAEPPFGGGNLIYRLPFIYVPECAACGRILKPGEYKRGEGDTSVCPECAERFLAPKYWEMPPSPPMMPDYMRKDGGKKKP